MRVARAGRAFVGLAGLTAWAVYGLPRVPPAAAEALGRLGNAWERRSESAEEAFGRERGTPYLDALRRIRAAIPADDAYYLVPVDGEGAAFVVRFDLAPRKPVLLPDTGPDFHPIEGSPRWIVLAHVTGGGPVLIDRFQAGADGGPQ